MNAVSAVVTLAPAKLNDGSLPIGLGSIVLMFGELLLLSAFAFIGARVYFYVRGLFKKDPIKWNS